MANNYVYMLGGKPYINLTNRCHNACTFCIRNSGDGVCGTPLWLDKEPTADEVIAQFDRFNVERGAEAVFCGYGEPTENLEVLKAVAKELKSRGYKTRLNTNGLGSLVNGRDISTELDDMDVISVSLNNHTAEKYAAVTRSAYGTDALDGVIDFAVKCKANRRNVVFTVVDTIGEKDIAECVKLCEKLGIPLRVREYISDNYNNGKRS